MTRDPFIPDPKDTKATVFPPADGERIVSARPGPVADDTPRDPLAAEFRFTTWDDSTLVVTVDEEDPGDIGEPRMVEDYDDNTSYISVRATLDATRPSDDTPRDPLPEATLEWLRSMLAEPERPEIDYREAALALIATLDATRPSGDEALLLAVEEVDNAWHDEGDHIEYHEELPERLITLRDKYAALATPSSTPDVEAPHAED